MNKVNSKPFHSSVTTLCSLSVIGGTLAITGTYLLVTFAPHTSTHITAHLVQYYAVSWHFLLYLVCNNVCKHVLASELLFTCPNGLPRIIVYF